jgi:hypothetical protein
MQHNSPEYVHALVEALRCGTLAEPLLCPDLLVFLVASGLLSLV